MQKEYPPLSFVCAIGEENLKNLFPFMTGDKKVDESIAERYADKDQRFEILDIVTCEIMELDTKVTVGSDEEFANNAHRLEEISLKAIAYDALLRPIRIQEAPYEQGRKQ